MRLTGKEKSYPGELSGGQQQRVAIARALAMRPSVMLFDEVTAALDPETRKEVLVTIRQLVEEGMTSILVTHEMAFAREIADHVYFTDHGVIVEDGPPAQLFGAPQKERTRAFLEQVFRACSRYGHIRVAWQKTPGARRGGEGGSGTRRDFATQRWAFSAATRRERPPWGATLRYSPGEDTRSSRRRAPRLAPHSDRSRLRP